MQFDSFTFLIFFLITFTVYRFLPRWRSQKILLLLASYLFYAAWSPPLVILIWISTLTDFIIAKQLKNVSISCYRRFLLIISLTINLGLLGYFKYANFLLQICKDITGMVGIAYSPPGFDVILPIGISFYTFQSLSYTIDVYRDQISPTDSLLDFSLFVTFFPQLVAGPIVRARDFLPQCKEPKRVNAQSVTWGLCLIIWGLFQKTVLADKFFAPLVESFFNNPMSHAGLDAWLSVTSFSMQIYCDFAGYSLCAVGAGIVLGFSLPDNFNAPYAAVGFSDFWRRWHISLSQWFRDYLYIPLGGNRDGRIKTVRNLFVIMLFGGLWHGASWNFVFWGLLHGLYLGGEQLLKKWQLSKTPPIILITITFVITTLTWIPFRSPNTSTSLLAVKALLPVSEFVFPVWDIQQIKAAFAILILLVYQYMRRNKSLDQMMKGCPASLQGAMLAVVTLTIAVFSTGDSHAFIYFQF